MSVNSGPYFDNFHAVLIFPTLPCKLVYIVSRYILAAATLN